MYIAVNVHYHPRILRFELYRQQQQQQHKLYLHDYNYEKTLRYRLRILNPRSRSLPKSRIYHSILLMVMHFFERKDAVSQNC